MFGKKGNEEVRVPLLGNGSSFDELAGGMASGSISRGRAIKLAGGTLLGAALLPFAASEAGAKKKKNRCKGKPAISNKRCAESEDGICGGSGTCFCAKTVEGKKRCVNLSDEQCPETDECDRSKDCPGNEFCIEVGACCEGSRRNLCVAPCAA